MPTLKSSDPGANLASLRKKIAGLVAKNAVPMVQCAIDGVIEDGQYQAIKYLFEMVGIYPAVVSKADESEDSLSKVLLKHLGVSLPEQGPWPHRTEDGGSDPVE